MNAQKLKLDHWIIDLATGEVRGDTHNEIESAQELRIEPQGIRFLQVLAEQPRQLISKENLLAQIWQDSIVSDDALTRCVSRVRKVLSDDPRKPALVETLPKRGYRLIANDVEFLSGCQFNSDSSAVEQVVSGEKSSSISTRNKKWLLMITVFLIAVFSGAWWAADWTQLNQPNTSEPTANDTQRQDSERLVARGDDYYAQIRRLDNEMAIELYQQALAIKPRSGAARAGMANALVQQVLRWPNEASEAELYFNGLHQAIKDGRTQTPEAQSKLQKALEYAQKAVQLAPEDPRTHKALGLVLAARAEFADALTSYKKAVQLNPDAWDALINIGDILQNAGDDEQAIKYFERTFDAMSRVSAEQSVRVRPWRADMGAIVGERYLAIGKDNEAEVWFRHVLSFAPLNLRATRGLVKLATKQGNSSGAERICAEYLQRAGEDLCIDSAQ